MPPVEPRDEKSIFLEALQKAGANREAFLQAACGENQKLRAEVEVLLAASDRSGDLLDVSATGAFSPTLVNPVNVPAPGASIGPYRLLQQIGEGGMGTVFMAEQSHPVQRKVALKIIKPGMDTRQVVARFEAERQALALMDHPHIAKVLDAGTTDGGLPYFVMELVKGVPLTKYCDDHRLTPRQRLELFIPVCQAIQHAHQKGIIHRDLKPSNVLVALYDGRPVPKVIDFGVAKATGQKLTDRTMYTEFGAIVGTLEYMSPEQAELNQLDIDTRSDIYSLGVLLYELLTGTTPFEKKRLKNAALMEVLRIIREDEPPKPSTRLSTTDELPSISANRGLEPSRLSALVRGDLDWIVMKALDKDRNRRYETANGFALDIQRYLADEPVLACPPSAAYRFRKFTHRNRGPVLAAALVLVALLVGIAGTTIGLLHAQAERDKAVAAKESERLAVIDAEENLQTARDAVDQMYTRAAEEMADKPQLELIRRALLEDALKFYRGFQKKKSDDPAILYESALLHRRVGEIYALLGYLKESLDNHRQSVELLTSLSSGYANDVNYRDQLARAHFHTADVLLNLVLLDEGDASMRQAIALWESLTDEFPDRPSYLEALARANHKLGHLWGSSYEVRGEPYAIRGQQLLVKLKQKFPDYEISTAFKSEIKGGDLWRFSNLPHDIANLQRLEKECRNRLAAAEAENADHPDVPKYQIDVAGWVARLGNVLAAQNRPDEALQLRLRNLEIIKQIAARHPDVPEFQRNLAWSHYELAQLLHDAGRYDEALDHSRTAIGLTNDLATQFPDHARTLMHLAEMVRGCPAPQLRDPKRALQLAQRVNSLGHSNWEDLALVQMDAGLYRESLETCKKWSGTGRQAGVIGYVTAIAYWHQGRQSEARELARQVVQEFGIQPSKYWYHPEFRRRGRELASLMGFDLDSLKTADPETVLRNGISIYRRLVVERSGDTGLFHELAGRYTELYRMLRAGGRNDEANVLLRQAIADYSQALEAEPNLAEAWRSRAELFIELKLVPEAAADFARAFQNQEPSDSLVFMCDTMLRRYAHDESGYRDACRRMLSRFAESTDPELGIRLAIALESAPASIAEPSRIVNFAERAVADQKTVWRLAYLGLALLRGGQFQRSLAALDEASKVDPNWNPALVLSIRAMAQFHLGDVANSSLTLDKAGRALLAREQVMLVKPIGYYPSVWQDIVHEQMLYGEAYRLVRGSPAPENARWLVLRGRGLRLLGRTDEARGAFESAIRLEPDNLGIRVGALPDFSQSEDFARGIAELRTFLADRPDQAEKGRFRVAQVQLQWAAREWNAGRNEIAEGALAQAANLVPELKELLKPVDRNAILAVCRKLAEESLTEDGFRMQLGHSFWNLSDQLGSRGQFAQAEEALRTALALFEKLAIDYRDIPHYRVEVGFSHWKLGWLLSRQNQNAQAEEPFRQALAVYQQLVEDNPGIPSLRLRLQPSHRELASNLARQGKHADADVEWDKAAAEASKTIELMPDNWESWSGRAVVHFHRQRWEDAAVDFSKAIDLAPDMHASWWHRGQAYLNLAQWDKAAGNFTGMVEQWPNGVEGWYYRGVARAKLNQPDQAIADLRQAFSKGFRNVELLKTDPRLDALRARDDFRTLLKEMEAKLPRVDPARPYILLSQWDKAAATFEKVDVWARPLREEVVFARACLYLIQGDRVGYDKFCRELLQRVAKTEDHFEAFVLARTCGLGPRSPADSARVVQWAKQAVAGEQHPWYLHALGLAQLRAGQFDEALQSFSKADVEAWGDSRGLNWFGMALLHHGQGHSDKARECLDKGIQWLERFRSPDPGQPANMHPMDWLEAHVLRREAEDLLKDTETR
jgi:serine/threonine protein kinase/Tfp pilus assembly protein PilF